MKDSTIDSSEINQTIEGNSSKSTSETTLLRKIQIRASELGCRLFRNNVGVFRMLHDNRIIRAGIPGTSDLIGWVPITIKPEHVGKTVAVYFAAEVKTPKGKITKQQSAFLAAVNSDGGIGAVIRDERDIDEWVTTIKA